MLAVAFAASCLGGRRQPASAWPPPDFYFEIEEVESPGADRAEAALQARRRLRVWSDGTLLLQKAAGTVRSADGSLALPVFDTTCAYRLLPETTRLLSRKMWKRGAHDLQQETVEADVRLRFAYRGMGHDLRVAAGPQVHGNLARVLRVVNAFLPANEEFAFPGMPGDREPSILTGVPEPQRVIGGALGCLRELLQQFPGDRLLLLDAFVLACKVGDGAGARQLLAAWAALPRTTGLADAPFMAPPLTVEQLRELLPSGG